MSDVKATTALRTNRYGDFADNAKLTQSLMNVMHTHKNWQDLPLPHREAVHMIFHKIARMTCGDCMYEDNPHDIAGYAILLEKYISEVNNG
jgi:hypothetical protein